jgi:hypothetical protein
LRFAISSALSSLRRTFPAVLLGSASKPIKPLLLSVYTGSAMRPVGDYSIHFSNNRTVSLRASGLLNPHAIFARTHAGAGRKELAGSRQH